MKSVKLKLAAGAAGLGVVLGGGAAVAATALSPKEESAAIVADAAEQLGVTSAELTAALKTATKNRVDAALAADEITPAQATEMKERIDAGEVPIVGFGPGRGHHGPGHHGPGHHGLVGLDAAAAFLGLTEAQLNDRLEGGDTLAEVAEGEGKSVAGLVDALVAAAKALLDEEVAEGSITAAERTRILANLEARVEEAVNGELPPGRGAHDPRLDDGDDA